MRRPTRPEKDDGLGIASFIPPMPATNNPGTAAASEPGQQSPLDVRSVTLSIIAVFGAIFLLRYAQELFIPIVLGVLIAYALNPLVSGLTRLRIPRTVAATLVILGIIGGVASGLYALRNQASAALETLPETVQQVRLKLSELRRASPDSTTAIDKLQKAAKEIERTAEEATGAKQAAQRGGVTRVQIDEPAFRANEFLVSGSLGMLALIGQAAMVCFLVFFLLASGDLFKRKLVRIIGSTLSEKRVTVETINEITTGVERFLLIQAATGVLVGICTGVALWALGVRQPAVWGLAAGILNSVPYFGAIIVTASLALIAFLQFGTLGATLQVAGTAFAITGLEGFLLTPALMGKAARINGVSMFLSLLFWSWLWGVIGMIVAVPLMMVIKSVCDRIESLQPLGELLGE